MKRFITFSDSWINIDQTESMEFEEEKMELNVFCMKFVHTYKFKDKETMDYVKERFKEFLTYINIPDEINMEDGSVMPGSVFDIDRIIEIWEGFGKQFEALKHTQPMEKKKK